MKRVLVNSDPPSGEGGNGFVSRFRKVAAFARDCVRLHTTQENSRHSRPFFSIRVKSLCFPDFFNANGTRIPANVKNLIGFAEFPSSLSKKSSFLLAGLTIILLAGCTQEQSLNDPVVFSENEKREIFKLSPLPPLPENPTNAFADHPDAAKLGQRLFFEKRLSANGEISCATCHDPTKGFSDGKPLSEGLKTTDRHSPTIWNVAYQSWLFWDGRADSLWAQSIQPLHSANEMGATARQLYDVIAGDADLLAAYEGVFGKGSPESLDRFVSNLGKAFEAYQRKIISTNSPFDQFVADLKSGNEDSDAISLAAKRGLRLFVGRGQCVLCHAGPNFSDGEFHNIGLPKVEGEKRDTGRYEGIRKVLNDPFNGLGDFSDDSSEETNIKLRYLVVKLNNLGEFKTPTLRNIATSAPYMHNGSFPELRDVLQFYNKLPGEAEIGHREETLVPLEFSEREKEDLAEFLKTLTGKELDDGLIRVE